VRLHGSASNNPLLVTGDNEITRNLQEIRRSGS
jgi:hypothetical protein